MDQRISFWMILVKGLVIIFSCVSWGLLLCVGFWLGSKLTKKIDSWLAKDDVEQAYRKALEEGRNPLE